ncbi:MAG: helix-turn-helix transcriptional regulator [Pseudomonadota bacterium]
MDIHSEIVKHARIERGWTQQQLAEVADLSLRTVQRVENQGSASHETISALSAVLELERTHILAIDPDRPDHQRAIKQARILLPAAVTIGAILGSSATYLLLGLINA